MRSSFDHIQLNFAVRIYPSKELGNLVALRKRSLMAFNSKEFTHSNWNPDIHIYYEQRNTLTKQLRKLNVVQITFTKLPADRATQFYTPRVRVRLDWLSPKTTTSQLLGVAKSVCGMFLWKEVGSSMKQLCSKYLDVKVTGSIGLPKKFSRKKFDSFSEETDLMEYSRFTTFEL